MHNIIATIERDSKVIHTVVRQMEHDPIVKVGSLFRYGSGKKWTVTAIERQQ